MRFELEPLATGVELDVDDAEDLKSVTFELVKLALDVDGDALNVVEDALNVVEELEAFDKLAGKMKPLDAAMELDVDTNGMVKALLLATEPDVANDFDTLGLLKGAFEVAEEVVESTLLELKAEVEVDFPLDTDEVDEAVESVGEVMVLALLDLESELKDGFWLDCIDMDEAVKRFEKVADELTELLVLALEVELVVDNVATDEVLGAAEEFERSEDATVFEVDAEEL